MTGVSETLNAITASTQFVEAGARKLAYRSIGAGAPLILCVPFRRVLDTWDPAFLDALAKSFRGITFDYIQSCGRTIKSAWSFRAISPPTQHRES